VLAAAGGAPARFVGLWGLPFALGALRGGLGRALPGRPDRGGPGVGGDHPPARAGAGARAPLHPHQLLLADLARRVFTYRLERAHNGDVPALLVAWLDVAAVDPDPGRLHAADRAPGPRHERCGPAA